MTGYDKINAYRNAFASVDKINQVIMLYDTAIASMQQARQAIIDKKIEEKFNTISKAFKIITGLRDALDVNNGGDVARILSEWYSGTSLRILSVSRTEDLDMCDLCIKHIKQMRDAWLEVENQIKSGNPDANSESTSSETKNSSGSGPLEAANNDFFEAVTKAAIYGGGMNISI